MNTITRKARPEDMGITETIAEMKRLSDEMFRPRSFRDANQEYKKAANAKLDSSFRKVSVCTHEITDVPEYMREQPETCVNCDGTDVTYDTDCNQFWCNSCNDWSHLNTSKHDQMEGYL